jgi:dTDP-4-amino-4,6-dideoxygalactose transaminase
MSKLAINGGEKIRTKPWLKWPVWDEHEIKALEEVIRSGHWGRLDGGTKVAEFEKAFAAYQDAKFGIAVTSGTAALTVALKAAGIDVGDEVIVPAYTFIATASCALQVNAIPVFVDVELDTINIDPVAIEAAITPRTRAIIPVHWQGRAVDMDRILDIAKRHNLVVVEDACHGWGATWKDRKVGAIGNLGGFSFQSSKNITSGEGGIVLTDDEELAGKAYSYQHIGRLPGRPFYEHHYVGWNFRMTEFEAAVLLAQLDRLEEQTLRREENAKFLDERLSHIEGIRPLRREPYMTRISWHGYSFRYEEDAFGGVPRARFLQALNAEGVRAGGGYSHTLYKNPLFIERRFGRITEFVKFPDYRAVNCPNSERLCQEHVILDHAMLLGTLEDMRDIVSAVEKIRENVEELRP